MYQNRYFFMNIPAPFDYLEDEDGPAILRAALAYYGLQELAGPANNKTILAWAKNVGADSYYLSDATPWCALFIAQCAKTAGFKLPPDPLAALSWAEFGTAVKDGPMLGDVLVKKRVGGGHVGLYVAESDTHYFVLGGNQNNEVCIAPFLKSAFTHVRRCKWKVAQPTSVRRVHVKQKGKALVVSEA